MYLLLNLDNWTEVIVEINRRIQVTIVGLFILKEQINYWKY